MDTYQYGVVLLPFSLDECHVLQAVALLTERNQAKMAVVSRHIDLLAFFDDALLAQSVGYHILDGDDLQIVLLGKLHQLWQTGHRAVFIHDFY